MNNKFITICFILFAFFTVSVFAYSLQATEKEDEFYPNFLLHNSTSACMQGVVLLIVSPSTIFPKVNLSDTFLDIDDNFCSKSSILVLELSI